MNRLIIYLLLACAIPAIAECPDYSTDSYMDKGPIKVYSTLEENEFEGESFCNKNIFETVIVYMENATKIVGPRVGLVTDIEVKGNMIYAIYWAAASNFYQTIVKVSEGKLVTVSQYKVPERP